MRMLLNVRIPHEEFNKAVKDGSSSLINEGWGSRFLGFTAATPETG